MTSRRISSSAQIFEGPVTLWRILFAAFLLMHALVAAPAAVLTFDDLRRSVQVGEGYALGGVHFSMSDAGVQEGLANGDSGGWLLNGTSGPGFLGFNNITPSTYAMTLTFDTVVTAFSLDSSRSFGSSSGDALTVSAFLGATLVDQQTIAFGGVNQWSTLSLGGNFNRIEWSGAGSGFHPYGVDNVAFTAVPEPALWPLGASLAFAFATRRTLHFNLACKRRSKCAREK